jgi:hypothetical protein
MTISRWFLLRIRNVSKESCRDKTHSLCSVTIFPQMFRLWDNVEKLGGARGSEMAIWRMRVSCWTSKDTRAQAHTPAPMHPHPHTDTAVCNTYCFPTTTGVTLTHIDVHCCFVHFIVDCNLFLIDAIKACIGRRGVSPLMFKSWEEYRYPFSGRLVGFRAGVDDLENKIFFSCRESNPLYIIA